MRDVNAMIQRLISLQLARMEKLQGLLHDEIVLDLFDTLLRSQIQEVIGDKEQGLYFVGACLIFYVKIFGRRPNRAISRTSRRPRTSSALPERLWMVGRVALTFSP